jgi:hypothetical protein
VHHVLDAASFWRRSLALFPMLNSQEYRVYAKEARQIALTSSVPPVRASWSQSALDWLNMAAVADGQTAMEAALLATREAGPANQNNLGHPKGDRSVSSLST